MRPACPKCKIALGKDRMKERHLDGLQGWVSYGRMRYTCRRCRKGYYPLDRKLKLSPSSRMSEGKEKQIALLSVRLPYEEAKKVYEELTGFPVGRMTAHRTVQRLGPSQRQDSRAQEMKPQQGKPHLTADGTMIHIREEGWKEAKVGAHYQVDSDRRAQEVRYAATLEGSERLGEALYRLSGKPTAEETHSMAFVGDAAEWIENLKEFYFPKATLIVDFWHAAEYLWKAAGACYREGSQKAIRWAEDRTQRLREGRHQTIRRALSRMKPKTEEQKEILKNTKRYFRNHAHKMDYPRYEQRGFHIGSGIAEGACKYVIQSRFKQAGMRWSRKGAENLLRLRVAYLNNGLLEMPEHALN